jgi:F1F0 ATPase subunit 2
MWMSDILSLGMALVAGGLLGAFFFGGLWWTVQKGVASDLPALWFLISLLLRTGIVLGGIYLVSQGHWSRAVACLFGFLIARTVVTRRLAHMPVHERTESEEGAHSAN